MGHDWKGGILKAKQTAYRPADRLQVKPLPYKDMIEMHLELLADEYPSVDWLTHAYLLASGANRIASASYLLGHWNVAKEWSGKTAEAGINYLFGDWKYKTTHDNGKVDAEAWFEQEPSIKWAEYLSQSLAWAAIGDYWNYVDRLLEFPTPRVTSDSDGRIARDYYLGLARWWKDASDVSWIADVKQVRGAGSKGVHLLCDAVRAIQCGNGDSVTSALKSYVEWFLKRRAHNDQFPLPAMFIWHVARRKGLTVHLPENIDMYIFHLPEGT